MLPTREKAEKILIEFEQMNPGPWGNHCRVAALCAEKIAAKSGLDAQKAYILGLLHDIGRRFGISQLGHVYDGYRYMTHLGYDEVARICLTHSFNTKNIDDYIGNYDVSKEAIDEMTAVLDTLVYDDYDRLIQLCDCLAAADGVVDMAKRMDDVARRYNRYPEQKRQSNFDLKAYFEQKTSENIYKTTSDNKELWGL